MPHIEIQSLGGKSFQVDSEKYATVADLKQYLQEQVGTPARKLQLLRGEEQLRNGQGLGKLLFNEGETLTVVISHPLCFDPSTVAVSGELSLPQGTAEDLELWSETHLACTKMEWSQGAGIKTNNVLEEGQKLMLVPSGKQVSPGVSLTKEPVTGNRFHDESCGVYIDAKFFHHGNDDKGSFNIRNRLEDDWSDDSCWLAVSYEQQTISFKIPGYGPFEVPVPESFRDRELYGHIFVWNGCSVRLALQDDDS